MSINSRLTRFTSVLAAITILNSIALAGASWVGTWKLNLSKSEFSPGPPPQSQTVSIGLDYDAFKVIIDGIDAQGNTTHSEYRSKFDGQEVPWKGSPDADTASPRATGIYSYENISKKGGKETITTRVVISLENRTLTAIQTGKDPEGRAVNHRAVYDKTCCFTAGTGSGSDPVLANRATKSQLAASN